MFRQLLLSLALVCLGAFVAMTALHQAEPPQALPLVRADYQRCLTIRPGPIKPPTRPVFNAHASEIV